MRWLLERIAGVACHGLDARSLCVGGEVLPFCGRCTGFYIGIAATALALAGAGRLRRHRLPSAPTIALLCVPWAMSGAARLLEMGGYDVAGNLGRALLGFACGASATMLLAPLWARVLWPQGSPPRRSAAATVGLAALMAAVGLAAVAGIPPAARYYLAAVATAVGFLTAATAVNALVLVAIMARGDGGFRLVRAALPACAAAVEIAGLSMMGSWLRVW